MAIPPIAPLRVWFRATAPFLRKVLSQWRNLYDHVRFTQDSGSSLRERAGVAGTSDGSGGNHLRAEGQLLHPDCGSAAGPGVAGPTGGAALGKTADGLGAAGEPVGGSSGGFASAGLLLELSASRVRDRCPGSGCGQVAVRFS